MSRVVNNAAQIEQRIAKGWKPNRYLSNMSLACYAEGTDHVATSIFPICPVGESTGFYYEFSREDIMRDNFQRKPAFGKVTPAKMGHTDNTYKCEVDQIIVGIDQISSLNYVRGGAPASIDPRRAKVRFVTEQSDLHMNRLFAQRFFKSGVWTNQWEGVASNPSGKQSLKFSDANFDPVHFFDTRSIEMKREGGRRPNKLSLGVDAYEALKNHPDILERVKYMGSTANPALVNTSVLAQLFGLEQVVVLEAVENVAEEGQNADYQFICDAGSALLTYTTNAPAIDTITAGYIFTWDMLGNGNWIAIDQFEGAGGTHSEFIEGLQASDMKIVCQELGMYFHGMV